MPSHALSEKDRLRLAALMKTPLIRKPPDGAKEPDRPRKQSEVWRRLRESSLSAARRVRESAPVVMRHLRDWSRRDWTLADPGQYREWGRLAGGHVRKYWREWAVGATAMVICLGVLSLAVAIKGRQSRASIQLQALDQKGELQIQWDPDAAPIRRAVGAKLFISDASERIFVKLNPERLQRGTVRYSRRSNRVDLRMTLDEPDGGMVEEYATFVGASRPIPRQLQAVLHPQEPETLPPNSTQPGSLQPSPPRTEQRARTKSVTSGTHLPFTCSVGDVFHKTDAPAGWDTFGCRARNVWTILRTHASGENRSINQSTPSATTATAKPASASTI